MKENRKSFPILFFFLIGMLLVSTPAKSNTYLRQDPGHESETIGVDMFQTDTIKTIETTTESQEILSVSKPVVRLREMLNWQI